jgi:adenosylhomocysteine nucleosidase
MLPSPPMFPRTACVAAVLLMTACTTGRAGTPAGASSSHPIVVQGAMDVEVRRLATTLNGATQTQIADWTFWTGTIDDYPVVISKTRRGTMNAAAATAIAVEHFHPAAIINQGTAGGHQPDLHVYDIVVGKESVNLGALRTPFRVRGAGSNVSDWGPIDLLKSDSVSVGSDPHAQVIRRFSGDSRLLTAALGVRDRYRRGRVVEGVIGSSDTWNSELDRIQRLHDQFGTSVEEMETAPAAQIARSFEVPFLGLRVLSNNITNGDAYDARTAEACQDYVLEVVKRYIRASSAH